jgi:GntR family transcriptional regulator
MEFSKGNIPVYFQFYLKLRSDILSGEIRTGSKIPTIDDLSDRFGISQSSVRKCMEILEKEGLIRKKPGVGTVVPEHVDLNLFNLATMKIRDAWELLNTASIEVLSSGWVEPSEKMIHLFEVTEKTPGDSIMKMKTIMTIKINPRIKAVATFYFSRLFLEEIHGDISEKPGDLLLKAFRWITATPIKVTDILRPSICSIEDAKLLDIPDGIPIFSHSEIIRDGENRVRLCTDWISTGNIIVSHSKLTAT